MLVACAALAPAAHPAGPADVVRAPDAPFRAPYVPSMDAEVLQQVPAASDPKVREMTQLHTSFNADPTDLHTALELAQSLYRVRTAQSATPTMPAMPKR